MATDNKAKITLEVDQSGLGAQLRDVVGTLQENFKGLLVGFLAGGGFTQAVRLMVELGQAADQAAQHAVELNKTLNSFNAQTVTSNLSKINDELARMAQLEQQATESRGVMGIASTGLQIKQFWSEFFGFSDKPDDVRKAFVERFNAITSITEAAKQTQLKMKSAERDVGLLSTRQTAAGRLGDLATVQSLQGEIDAATATREDLARKNLQRSQDERMAGIIGLTGEEGRRARDVMRKTFEAESADLEKEQEASRTRQRERSAQLVRSIEADLAQVKMARDRLAVAQEEQDARFAANAVKREEDRKVAALKASETIMDAERSLAQARAEAQGTILDDVQRTADERRRITDETAAAEIRSVEAETAAILKSLAARRAQAQRELGGLGALEGVLPAPELQRRRDALRAQVTSLSGEINEAAARGASERAAIEERAMIQQRQTFLREQRERLSIAQDTLRQEVGIRQAMTGTLTTLGLRTSGQGIAEQFGLAAATPGRPQQAAAFQQAANMLAQQQQASRGAAGGILGAVSERLGGEGSIQDVAQAFAEIRQESKQTIADFRGGGAVDLGELQKSMGLLPLMEQADKLGGVGAIFGQAATPLADQFKKAAGPEGMTAFDALAQSAETPLGDLEANFQSTFDRITAIIDAAAAEWSSTISKAAVDMAKAIEDQLVRNLDLAKAKR